MSAAEVSVVVPVRDRAGVVASAVASALSQSPSPVEVVVVDDGSSDGSGAAAAIDPRVRVISFPEAGGPSRARNAGIAAARGALVAFLDSDDVWLPGGLAARLEMFAANRDLVLVSGDALWTGDAALEGTRLLGGDPLAAGGDLFQRLVLGNFVLTSTVIARREALLDVGGFPEEMRRCEDYHLWLRLAWRARGRRAFAFADRPVARYRRDASGLSADREAMLDGEVEALERLVGLDGLEPRSETARLIAREVVRRRVVQAYADLEAGRRRAARRKLADALRRGGLRAKPAVYLVASFLPLRFSALRAARRALMSEARPAGDDR
ncbi:MAG: glycosyltransferase family A protein [Candidatus Polarisedimenticolia bacterium]|nr:glycosyltransferase family 2 protein [bacterium]